MLLVEAERAQALGLRPMARIVSTAVAGVDPAIMGYGPVPATRKALERAGIGVDDLDLVELNGPSHPSRSLHRRAGARQKVNVNGGAIAHGHLRMSGAADHDAQPGLSRTGGRWGLATTCIGVGQDRDGHRRIDG